MEVVTRARSKSSTVEKERGKEIVNGLLSKEVNIGDLLWVKLPKSSWWPGQVVGGDTVGPSVKPNRKQSSGDVLVRLYGSYEYTYVNVAESNAEFKNVLAENDFNHIDILKKTLDLELCSLKSSRSRRSESKGKVDIGASQDGLSEQDIPGNIQARRKNGNQTTLKTNDSQPETLEAKGNNKRQKQDGLHNKVEPRTPTTPSTVSLISPELSARRTKVMQSLGLIAPSGSPFRSGLVSPSRAVC